MSIGTNIDLIRSFARNDRAMVYGFTHCKYEKVKTFLITNGIHLYDSTLGCESLYNPLISKIISRTNEDGLSGEESSKRLCKAALVNLIGHNYLLSLNGIAPVPIFFCIDIENNPHPLTAQNLADRAQDFITHSELRRAYKLCCDPSLDYRIRLIAQQSIHFVKLQDRSTTFAYNFSFILINAPWESPDFAKALELRQQTPKIRVLPNGCAAWQTQMHSLCGLHKKSWNHSFWDFFCCRT